MASSQLAPTGDTYSASVLSWPVPQHIMWISNSLEKCGTSCSGTMCSTMKTRAGPASRLPDVGQNLDALCVVPIVKDHLEAVGVGLGHGFEHVAGHVLASLLKRELRRP